MGAIRNLQLGDAHRRKSIDVRVADTPVYGWQNVWLKLLERRDPNSMLSQLFPEGLGFPVEGEFRLVHNMCSRTARGNAFIALHIDVAHRTHIEFHKESPFWILQGVLMRAVHIAESVSAVDNDKSCEAYMMPTTYILDLEGVLGQESSKAIRLLHPTDMSRSVSIEFPIVCVPKAVPVLDGLQKVEDLATIRSRVRDLYRSLDGERDHRDMELFKLCAALSDHRLYTEGGANHGYIDLITADSDRLTRDALQFNPRLEK